MTSSAADLVGTTLAHGRYEILAKLGEGGMADVFRAADRHLQTPVVIKIPKPAIRRDPEFSKRFVREVRALVQLVHPRVVRVIDVGRQEDLPYVVLQYLTGGSLEEQLCRPELGKSPAASLIDVARWLTGVAEALDFIHAQGYVHRDVKPANILFDNHGNVFLSDFGIAKILAGKHGPQKTVLTTLGVVVGTPQYLPPEIIGGKPYDGRADQYALAVTVYRALGGRLPFDGPTANLVFQKLLEAAPPTLHETCPEVPLAVSEAVHQGLAKDPRQRHANCLALARAVAAALATAPLSSAHSPVDKRTMSQRPWQPYPRRFRGLLAKPSLTGVALLGVVLAILGLAIFLGLLPWPSAQQPAVNSTPALAPAGQAGSGTPAVVEQLRLTPHGGKPVVAAVSPREPLVATASAGEGMKLWDLPSGRAVLTFSGDTKAINRMVFSPQGDRLVSVGEDRLVRLWDVTTGTELATFAGHESRVRGVAISPDGKRAASGSSDATIRIWDLETKKLWRLLDQHKADVMHVAFTPSGTHLLSGSDDATIRVWDLARLPAAQSISLGSDVWNVAVAPRESVFLANGREAPFQLWDWQSRSCQICAHGEVA